MVFYFQVVVAVASIATAVAASIAVAVAVASIATVVATAEEPPMEKNRKEKIRLSLDISPEVNQILEDLADATGGTKSDILRKAIVLMEVAVNAKRRGLKMGLAEQDQVLTTEIVGI